MVKNFLPATYSSLKTVVFHIFLISITISYVKTDNNINNKVLTFFLHDILGGLTPSERIVAGIIASSQTTNLPFSKPNNRVFPIKGGIPIAETNIGPNNPGSLSTTIVINNIDKNKVVHRNNKFPYVATLGNILFGRITVIDDEITRGHELGTLIIGKAQGFHLASSLDGSSRTMAFVALFHNEDRDDDEEEDAISFFGVHETVAIARESYLAVVGGAGKYVNAKGYAKIETVHLPDQHTINYGEETLLQITVYLS
ncbi:hypothetical protein RIF29_31991 [Crotalaria pallida]|uniref:Dirigent protein n=1 Tax=Crotalaria pallida TaxID=3830 RepID=A0AAN9HZ48_CROPI